MDTPTIDALLAEEGATTMHMDFTAHRYLAVEVDIETANDLRGVKGNEAAHDEIMEMKDEILRGLDTRLTKILKL